MVGRRTSLFYVVAVEEVNDLVTVSRVSIDKALMWGLEFSGPCSLQMCMLGDVHTSK